MASPGELVEAMAAALNIPVPTLTQHDRNLADAGIRPKSGRGWAVAKMAPRDAANLLVAVLGSDLVKDSVATIERYRMTVPRRHDSSPKLYGGLGLTELTVLPASHSFIDAIEAIFSSAANGSLAKLSPAIEIAALTPGTLGDVRISGTGVRTARSVRYALPEARPRRSSSKSPMAHAMGDLEQYRRISERTIFEVASLFADKPE